MTDKDSVTLVQAKTPESKMGSLLNVKFEIWQNLVRSVNILLSGFFRNIITGDFNIFFFA